MTTNTVITACEMIVAVAAPATPYLKTTTNIISKITFITEHTRIDKNGALLSPIPLNTAEYIL